MVGDDLDVNTVGNDLAVLLELMVFSLGVLGETEFQAGSDLLSAWILEHRSLQGHLGVLNVVRAASD